MADRLKSTIAIWSMIIGITVGVSGAVKAWMIMPYQIEQTEKEIKALKDDFRTTREILIRIEERVMQLQQRLRITGPSANAASTPEK